MNILKKYKGMYKPSILIAGLLRNNVYPEFTDFTNSLSIFHNDL